MPLKPVIEEEGSDDEETKLNSVRPIIDAWADCQPNTMEDAIPATQPALFTTLTMPPPPPVYVVRAVCREEIQSPRCLDATVDRTVGTVGFVGGVLMYFGFCCCLCSSGKAVRETYNGHTLCGLFCPLP